MTLTGTNAMTEILLNDLIVSFKKTDALFFEMRPEESRASRAGEDLIFMFTRESDLMQSQIAGFVSQLENGSTKPSPYWLMIFTKGFVLSDDPKYDAFYAEASARYPKIKANIGALFETYGLVQDYIRQEI